MKLGGWQRMYRVLLMIGMMWPSVSRVVSIYWGET
jgi:hypothetical protein